MKNMKPWQVLLFIFVVAIVLRLVVALYLGDQVPPQKDELSYSVLASRLVDGYGYSFPEGWYPFTTANTPTAHWSFLYSLFVAGIYTLFGVHPLAVRIVGSILGGVLLPLMAYRLSKQILPRNERVALLAAMFTAVYTYFILFAAQLMTETFYITALLYSLERAVALEKVLRNGRRPNSLLIISFGISLGIATLLRQSFLPWAVVLFAWLLLIGWQHKQVKNTFISLFVAGFILLAFILPFTIRNYLVYDGDFLLLNSNAGYAMYSAQHPFHGTSFQAFTAAPLPDDIDPQPQNEAQWDRVLMKRGLKFILAEPGRYVQLSLSRLVDYFQFWPSSQTTALHNAGRVFSFGLFLPLMVYGLWFSRRQHRTFMLLYLFILFYTVLHILTWSMIRYRLPVDAILLIFAAMGALNLAQGVVKRYGRYHHQQPAITNQ